MFNKWSLWEQSEAIYQCLFIHTSMKPRLPHIVVTVLKVPQRLDWRMSYLSEACASNNLLQSSLIEKRHSAQGYNKCSLALRFTILAANRMCICSEATVPQSLVCWRHLPAPRKWRLPTLRRTAWHAPQKGVAQLQQVMWLLFKTLSLRARQTGQARCGTFRPKPSSRRPSSGQNCKCACCACCLRPPQTADYKQSQGCILTIPGVLSAETTSIT